jgi:hypothetical protein
MIHVERRDGKKGAANPAPAEGGMDTFPPEEMTPEGAGALLKREIPLWGEVIRTNHITGQ